MDWSLAVQSSHDMFPFTWMFWSLGILWQPAHLGHNFQASFSCVVCLHIKVQLFVTSPNITLCRIPETVLFMHKFLSRLYLGFCLHSFWVLHLFTLSNGVIFSTMSQDDYIKYGVARR